MLAAVGAKLRVVQALCECDGLWNAEVPGEHLQDGLHPENPGAWRDNESSRQGFNVAAVLSHRGAIDSKVSDVDEASASYVDE